MFDAIIAFSLRRRVLIIVLTLALVAGGVFAFSRLPIDAIPDITNNQVQVLTAASALGSPDVERYVTVPIEVALKSLPDLLELRSLSRPGLSVVTVVFNDDVDIYFARAQVLERLREAERSMPDGVERPELAPVSTGLGEIFRYVVRDTTGKLSPMDLRTVQDWIVRRGLLGTAGLAEVNSLGGYVKQYHVEVDPDAMAGYGLTLRDVFDAVARTSGNTGGAYIETGPEQLSVRSVGLATSLDDLRSTALRSTATGTPVLLSDVAQVEVGPAIRFGSASQDGRGEVVTGIAMQLKGANARVTVDAVKERIEQVRPALPPGVVVEPYYDREVLVEETVATVLRNLIEGALLVVGVLLLFLVNLRAGLVVASVIPLSMLFAGIMMKLTGQTGNLMSLGAIDFGLVVDGSLIIVENCLRLLEERLHATGGAPLTGGEMRSLVYGGSTEVRKAAQFGEIIIIVVYLPILTLQGIEGKLFRPMAMTVGFALLGALLLSITYVPAILSLVMKRSGRVRRSPVVEWLARLYAPALRRALSWRLPVVAGTLVLFLVAAVAFTRMGGEFIPRLDEGDIAMHIIRLPSVSLSESQKITTQVERELMRFPEVRTVVSSTGRAEISTDPMGFELADAFVMLRPREEWRTARTKEELIDTMERRLRRVPGAGFQFLQPIEMRTNELIAGARGDMVIKVTGEDERAMYQAAAQIASIIRSTSGAADVTVEQAEGLPQLVIRPNRSAIARYGMTVEEVNDVVETAIGGRTAGEVAEGERRFEVVVRLAAPRRSSADAVRGLVVATPSGARVPLSELASVLVESGPVQINREEGTRFVAVQANVRGRDVESVVEEARARIAREVKLPPGCNVVYGGQFQHLEEASARLRIVVPIALALIFLLLYSTFRSVRLGLMIFLCVPMATIGGVAALMIGGLPFSISAGVGFIALFGVAVLNGIVMVAAIRKHQVAGEERRAAVLGGAVERLRPVVTTAALAGFGFVPMLLAQGAGAEVQRPLATVMIGGLISSTLLTLFVLPALYDWLGGNAAHGGEEWSAPPRRNTGARAGAVLGVMLLLLACGEALHAQTRTLLTRQVVRERAVGVVSANRRADALVAQRRAERAGGSILPPIELFGDIEEAQSPLLTGRPDARVGLAQTLAMPGVYSARSRAAELRVEGAEADRSVAIRSAQRAADFAWLELVAARQLLDLADSNVAVVEEFARAAARRRELGETGPLEPLRAGTLLASAERRRSEALVRYSEALATTRLLISAAGEEELVVADTLAYHALAVPLDTLVARALRSGPGLRAATLAIDVARAEEDVVAAAKLPEIALEYSLQTVDGRGGFYGGGLRLGLPLWRWTNSAPDEAARAATVARETERGVAERELRAAIIAVHTRYTASQSLVADYTERLLPQAAESYRISRRLFEEGEVLSLDRLLAQSALLDARSEYLLALYAAEQSRIELENLIGEGVQ